MAIVAIVTCWIRARRSFNNRIFRPDTTAQDYFDYINDNEFTPLTSSEFAASLQERPPTYLESERIEQDSETEGNSNGGNGNNESRLSPIPPPPQPHTLPSLTRLRVVQLENISLVSDGNSSSCATLGRNDDANMDVVPERTCPTTNLIDIDSNQTFHSALDSDDPLYT